MARLSPVPWWDTKRSKEEPHRRLIPLVHAIRDSQATRYANMRKMIEAYEGGTGGRGARSLDGIDDAKLHFPVAKNAIDTLHSQVCTPRVQPMLLTEGGNEMQRRRAKMATKAIEGVLEENDFESVTEDVVLDAQLSYCGFVRVFSEVSLDEDDEGVREGSDGEPRYVGEVKLERLSPEDVFVDEAEGWHRAPRCLYVRMTVDRYKLLADYGVADERLYGSVADRKTAIKRAETAVRDGTAVESENEDAIEVWEAWHLPSGRVRKNADGSVKTDGRHTICIANCTLLDEPWARPRFPIGVYRPDKARRGFWGLAVMRYALAGQREYERVTERLQRAHKTLGTANVIASKNAKLNTRELTNGTGRVIEVEGPIDQVQPFNPPPANPQTYEYRESLATDTLRFLGISTYASQSEVPAGLQQASGKALSAFEDVENKRIVVRHRERERLVVQVSLLILDEVKAMLDDGVLVTSRYPGKRDFERVDWKDLVEVLSDRNKYVVRIGLVGILSSSPAIKFAQLDSLFDRGAITVEQFRRELDMPDLEAENDIDAADTEIIDRNVDYMVMTGRYVSPQSFDDLALIKARAGKAYNAYRVKQVPDARLELIRRYIQDAEALAQEAQAAASAAAGPAGAGMTPPSPMSGGAPAGAPGLPPVSPSTLGAPPGVAA